MIHEMGHILGLYHVFKGVSERDSCDDPCQVTSKFLYLFISYYSFYFFLFIFFLKQITSKYRELSPLVIMLTKYSGMCT